MLDLEMFEARKRDMVDTSCKQALTLVFIENQEIEQVYEPETAFYRGTAFPDLDKPLNLGGHHNE